MESGYLNKLIDVQLIWIKIVPLRCLRRTATTLIDLFNGVIQLKCVGPGDFTTSIRKVVLNRQCLIAYKILNLKFSIQTKYYINFFLTRDHVIATKNTFYCDIVIELH